MVNAVFFDRDGVINKLLSGTNPRGPRKFEEFKFTDGVKEVIKEIAARGYHCEVISNQPDLSRGLLRHEEHAKIVEIIKTEIPEIKTQRYCIHDNQDNCICRKPGIELLKQSVIEFKVNPNASYFVGDTWVDVLAAKNFGCHSILFANRYSWKSTSQGDPPKKLFPDFEVNSISQILEIIKA